MNNQLYGKKYEIPETILNHLNNHSGEETIDNLLKSPENGISYSLLKKIKHRMENGEKPQLGGDTFLNWINNTLTSDRSGVEISKQAKSDVLPNSYNKSPNDGIDSLKNMNRPSKSHRKHMTDEQRITENLKRINELISKII